MGLIIAKNKVTLDQLQSIPTPQAERTPDRTVTVIHEDGRQEERIRKGRVWQPISHAFLANAIITGVNNAGFEVVESEHALARDGGHYFGGFAIRGEGADSDERRLVLGARNSHLKDFAASGCCGNSMVVCENLCFSSDEKLFRRHTLNIMGDIIGVIAKLIARGVQQFKRTGERFDAYRSTEISLEDARNLACLLAESDAIPARNILPVVEEFKNPTFAEFNSPTLWNLYNAVTWTLKGSDLQKLPVRTMIAQSILDGVSGFKTEDIVDVEVEISDSATPELAV